MPHINAAYWCQILMTHIDDTYWIQIDTTYWCCSSMAQINITFWRHIITLIYVGGSTSLVSFSNAPTARRIRLITYAASFGVSRRTVRKSWKSKRGPRSLATVFAHPGLWVWIFAVVTLREARSSFGVLFRSCGQTWWRFAAKKKTKYKIQTHTIILKSKSKTKQFLNFQK